MAPAPPISSTIKMAVDQASQRLSGASTETPRLDAEVLMGFVLGWPRARLFAHWDGGLADGDRATFQALVERRAAGEPVAYIRHFKEFLGLEFYVDSRVLIPRPETELLVTHALAWLAPRVGVHVMESEAKDLASCLSAGKVLRRCAPFHDKRRAPVVVDAGTGSGAIAIGIALGCPEARVFGTDTSADALAVARVNAERHHAAVELVRGSLLEPVAGPVDLVVANLPYLSLAEYESLLGTSIAYEPRAALTDEADGLRLFDALLAQVPAKLAPSGCVLLEIGSTQPAALQALARRHLPNFEAAVFADYAGLPRVLRLTDRC